MANYGYIDTKTSVCTGRAEEIISDAMRMCLGARWRVDRLDPNTWFVFLPGTEKRGREARAAVLADGDPVGFLVQLEDGARFAFRHGPNRFERWAQGRLEEQMADDLGIGVLYDATDTVKQPGTCYYRTGRTYREHLASRIGGGRPLTPEEDASIDREMYCVPEGHR